MTTEDRVKAVATFGFTDRQARFLVTVMLHSGVCLMRHYTAFAGIVHGQKTRKFFAKLVRRGYAAAYPCRHNRGRVYHLDHKPLYGAIGQTDSRHRRPLSAVGVMEGALLRMLPAWTLRVVFPPLTACLADCYDKTARNELAGLRPELVNYLQWYFARRRGHTLERAPIDDQERYDHAHYGFAATRFQVLYRRWLREGDTVLEAISSGAVGE